MGTTRIEWAGGWADLTDRLTHGRRMRIVAAMPTSDGSTEDTMRFAGELAAAHVVAMSDGAPIDPIYGPELARIDALPADAVDAITTTATRLWTGRADPNATAPSSAAGPSESASE